MTPQDLELLERIQGYSPDDPKSPLRFTERLARENAWHPTYADRVFEEYRRFMFLAVVCGHPVTPSDQVDQAWHLHLVYTRDYWDDFCRDVLGRPIHHGPTRGGRSESAKYDAWYERTLDSYRQWFDEEPPRDIWPPSEVRFGEDLAYRRVNVARSWVVRKPDWIRRLGQRSRSRTGRRTSIAGAVLVVPAAGAALATNPLDWFGPQFLALFAGLFVASALAAWWIGVRFHPQPRPLQLGGNPLRPAEVAFTTRGPAHALRTLLYGMLHDRVIDVRSPAGGEPARFFAGETSDEAPSPLRERVLVHLKAAPDGLELSDLRLGLSMDLLKMESNLMERGLVLSRSETRGVRLASALPMLATLGLGLAKIGVGMSRGRPVGFLVLGCILAALAAAFLAWNFSRASRDGKLHLTKLKSKQPRSDAAPPEATGPPLDIGSGSALAVALFGLGSMGLGNEATAALTRRQKYRDDGFASGGCDPVHHGVGGDGGGSDGGGCDGGGCGGCGD